MERSFVYAELRIQYTNSYTEVVYCRRIHRGDSYTVNTLVYVRDVTDDRYVREVRDVTDDRYVREVRDVTDDRDVRDIVRDIRDVVKDVRDLTLVSVCEFVYCIRTSSSINKYTNLRVYEPPLHRSLYPKTR